MRRFLILGLFAGLSATIFSAAPAQTDRVWEDANTAYMNNNYVEAIEGYESLISQGWESADLYINLGNAYYKRGMNGKAILNYNKALKLAPGSESAKFNLALANAGSVDKIEEIPVFFLKRWIAGIGTLFSGNGWAVMSLVWLALLSAFTVAYILGWSLGLRKIGFYGGLFSFILLAGSVYFASGLRSIALAPSEAIIMSEAIAVKSSPEAGSKDVFILHEGTKVKVLGTLGEFTDISIADGNRGWISSHAIELID